MALMKHSDSFKSGLLGAVPRLRAFAVSLCGSAGEADDLVQEALMKAWENGDRFAAGSNLDAWLFTILRNCFYSARRKRARETEDPDDAFAGALMSRPEQEARMDFLDFREAFLRLPPEQREALTLIGAEGMAYEEAAAICSCAVGTIKSRVSRARERLAQLLARVPMEGT